MLNKTKVWSYWDSTRYRLMHLNCNAESSASVMQWTKIFAGKGSCRRHPWEIYLTLNYSQYYSIYTNVIFRLYCNSIVSEHKLCYTRNTNWSQTLEKGPAFTFSNIYRIYQANEKKSRRPNHWWRWKQLTLIVQCFHRHEASVTNSKVLVLTHVW